MENRVILKLHLAVRLLVTLKNINRACSNECKYHEAFIWTEIIFIVLFPLFDVPIRPCLQVYTSDKNEIRDLMRHYSSKYRWPRITWRNVTSNVIANRGVSSWFIKRFRFIGLPSRYVHNYVYTIWNNLTIWPAQCMKLQFLQLLLLFYV